MNTVNTHLNLDFFLFSLFVCGGWVWTQGFQACKASALSLEPHLQSILFGYFGDGVLKTISLGLKLWSS
jgi:hypothetical protein